MKCICVGETNTYKLDTEIEAETETNADTETDTEADKQYSIDIGFLSAILSRELDANHG